MNHAATSGAKPQAVIDAVTAYMTQNSHHSAGRGGDELSAARALLDCRKALCELFGATDPCGVVFTSGATESLHLAIHGLITDGCHVLATGLEHNAVARPLHLLASAGRIAVTYLPVDENGRLDPETIADAVRPHTRLLVMTHASNVIGNALPVCAAFERAKQYGLYTVLDAAQTAGHIPVQLDENTDAIAFTGHKGLRGLSGTGGLVLNKGVADRMAVVKAGGTGSASECLDMPGFMPDKLEPGTPNTLGIIGLRAAIRHLTTTGLTAITKHERRLTTRLIEGLRTLPVTVYGVYDEQHWVPVVSLNAPGMDAGLLAHQLSKNYGIEARPGLHCAPLAHRAMGTYPAGTLRFSLGADTTAAEVDAVLRALAELTANGRRY